MPKRPSRWLVITRSVIGSKRPSRCSSRSWTRAGGTHAVVLLGAVTTTLAIAAGLDHARGKAVIIMDSDLQHPMALIPIFISKWREGYKNIYGQRMDRVTDPELRNFLTRVFYRLLDRFGDTSLPPGAGDFRLLDRQAVDALLKPPAELKGTALEVADAYCRDAAVAVETAKSFMARKHNQLATN
mgnify:CR=1 FL=1